MNGRMLRESIGGPGESHPLVRLDPRLKVGSCFLLLLLALTCEGYLFQLLLGSLSLLGALWLGVTPRRFILRFAEPAFIALVLVLLKTFLTPGEEIFSLSFYFLNVKATAEGLRAGLLIAARIWAAVSVVALVGFATSFSGIIAALSWYRLPREFIEILIFTHRFVFMLFEEAWGIYEAQRNRLGYAGVGRGLRSLGILAGSLTLRAFDHSRSTAESMVQRGYEGRLPMAEHRPLTRLELLLSLLVLSALVLAWTAL